MKETEEVKKAKAAAVAKLSALLRESFPMQSELARRLGIAVAIVSRWYRGAAFPSPRYAAQLAELLKLDPAALDLGAAIALGAFSPKALKVEALYLGGAPPALSYIEISPALFSLSARSARAPRSTLSNPAPWRPGARDLGGRRCPG